MKVRVEAFATLREIIGGMGKLLVELPDNADIKILLEKLREILGEEFGESVSEEKIMENSVKIFVNGRDIGFLQGLSTRLKEGDRVALIPPVAGG